MNFDLQTLKSTIDCGREGNTIMVPFGFPKMGENIAIGKKLYFAVGGQSGTGKTAFVDLAFVLLPYFWYIQNKDNTDIKIKWIYRSMERSKTYKLAKWVALKLYMDTGIIIEVPKLLGWRLKHKLSDDIYSKVIKSFDFFEEMLQDVEIIDGSINPTGIYMHVSEYARKVGENVEISYKTREGLLRNTQTYKTHNEKLITIIIIDHAGRSAGEKFEGKFLHPQSKELLDRLSTYCSSSFRDYYGFTPVLVSQFNRGLEDTERRVKTAMSPLPSDYKNTSNIYEDCDTALALYNPYKLGDLHNLGYKINDMVDEKGFNRYRSVYVLKNSYGVDDVAYGMKFTGECGYMEELKRANEMKQEDYLNIIQ